MNLHAFKYLAVFVILSHLLPGCGKVRSEVDDQMAPPVSRELVKSTQSWDGALLPAYPEGQPEVTILHITIPAGTRLSMHHHPVINAGVLISGQLKVFTEGGKTLELEAGDPIVEVVNTLHYGVNDGEVDAEIIVFYAGVVDEPFTIIEDK